jgi:hypothetical protein
VLTNCAENAASTPEFSYEQADFSYVRPKGKNHTVMRTTLDPAR